MLRDELMIHVFHFSRFNKSKLLEFLRESWANDRRVEWSIWMVYSKVEMPHRYISSAIDDTSYHGSNGRGPVLRKLTDDVIKSAFLGSLDNSGHPLFKHCSSQLSSDHFM